MKKIFSLLIFSAIVLNACNSGVSNPNEKPEISDLKERVITVHDTAMIEMNVLGKLASKLKERAKNSNDSIIYMEAYENTAEARQAMMDWMHKFDIPQREEASEEEVRAYLLEQEEKIKQVKAKMEEARIGAEKLLFENIAPESED